MPVLEGHRTSLPAGLVVAVSLLDLELLAIGEMVRCVLAAMSPL